MIIHHKPPEVIQAQIADYAQSGLPDSDPHDNNLRSQVFEDIGRLSVGPVADASYQIEEKERDPTDGFVVDRRTKDVTVSADNYRRHLKEWSGSRNPNVQRRVQYLEAYKDFAPQVEDILSRHISRSAEEAMDYIMGDDSHGKADDSEVGVGAYVTAVGFSHGGRDHILKITHEGSSRGGALQSDTRLWGLENGQGIAHLEQLAALSYEKGVVVTERLKGKDFTQSSVEVMARMTDAQFIQALETMRQAQEANIKFDTQNTANYIYDAHEGFGFVDYESEDGVDPQSYADKVGAFAVALAYMGAAEVDLETKDGYLREAANFASKISLMQRFRTVCEGHLSAEDYKAVTSVIQAATSNIQQFINDVNTPGWLDKVIETMQHVSRETAEVG